MASPGTDRDSLSTVVVTYNSSAELPALLTALIPQLRVEDELVVVDNGSTDGTQELVHTLAPRAVLLESGENLGFAGGCHAGVRATQAPLILFMNPDCRPADTCLAELRSAAHAHPEWAARQALVLLDDGRINTSGGVVHYLGVGWAGDCERPLDPALEQEREIAFPSGAAMMVRRDVWLALGGFDPDYFMYGEDLDFGLRLWLAGHRVGVVPSARVSHGYAFDKGAAKWYLLERNRWRTVLSVYPAPLLALLAPALLAFELVLLAVATRQGWLTAKVRAQIAVIAALPSSLARRRRLQRGRRISAFEFSAHLTASFSSPYLASRSTRLEKLQAIYWRAVLRTLAVLAR